MKGEQTTTMNTVDAAVTFIRTTNGPSKDDLLSGLQKPELAAALQRYRGSYITIVYNEDNPDMGRLVQRLYFTYGGMNQRQLAKSEGRWWRFTYPN